MFMPNEALLSEMPYEIQDNDDIEFIMMVTRRKKKTNITLYYGKSYLSKRQS